MGYYPTENDLKFASQLGFESKRDFSKFQRLRWFDRWELFRKTKAHRCRYHIPVFRDWGFPSGDSVQVRLWSISVERLVPGVLEGRLGLVLKYERSLKLHFTFEKRLQIMWSYPYGADSGNESSSESRWRNTCLQSPMTDWNLLNAGEGVYGALYPFGYLTYDSFLKPMFQFGFSLPLKQVWIEGLLCRLHTLMCV